MIVYNEATQNRDLCSPSDLDIIISPPLIVACFESSDDNVKSDLLTIWDNIESHTFFSM